MKFWNRIRHFRRREEWERDMAEELRLHREMAEEHAARAGAGPEQASRAAALAFGGAAQTLEASREQWQIRWLHEFIQDVRFALRGFRREPGFVISVCGILTVGLGLLAAAFTAFNAGVLRSYAVRDADQLYSLSWLSATTGRSTFTYREFLDIRRQTDVLEDAVASGDDNITINGAVTWVTTVSGNFFTSLGVRVCKGRPLQDSDDFAVGLAPTVISDALWKRRFGGKPEAIGTRLPAKPTDLVIVGVACPEFEGMSARAQEYWVSMPGSRWFAASPYSAGGTPMMRVTGRLRRGLPLEQAKAALVRYGKAADPMWRNFGYKPWSYYPAPTAVSLSPERSMVNWHDAVSTFAMTFVAFGLVLLAACANVSNLLLARGLARRSEIGVRLSLGASRARVVRQMMTENLLIAAVSAPLAFACAYAVGYGVRLLYSSGRGGGGYVFARWMTAQPDGATFAFLFAAAALTTLVFGLAPALHATRSSLTEAARGAFGDVRPSRLRNSMLAAQIAICAMLLMSVTSLLRTEMKRLETSGAKRMESVFSAFLNDANVAAAQAALAAIPLALPPAYELTQDLPTWGYPSAKMEGAASVAGAWFNCVSAGYFGLMEQRLVRGRNFPAEGSAGEAILSETAARKLWPGQNPLGQILRAPDGLRSGLSAWPFREARVVGVVEDDTRETEYARANPVYVYFSMPPDFRLENGFRGIALYKPRGTPAEARRMAMEVNARAWPDATRREPTSVGDALRKRITAYRLLLRVLSCLGTLALGLTLYGVYSVVAYVAAQRRKEIGIRVALGGQAGDVAGLVVRQTLALSVLGLGLAAWGAAATIRFLTSSQRLTVVVDAVGLGSGLILMALVTLAAAAWPAFRATRANVSTMLRCD